MKIAVLPQLNEAQFKLLQSKTQADLVAINESEITAADLAQFEIILGWSDKIVDALTMDHSIKWIQLWMVGVDSIPLDKLAEHEIIITTAKGANAPNIAQQIVGYLIMFTRHLHTSRDYQMKHQWERPADYGELTGKKALSIGTGEIGQAFAKIAQAFDVTVDGVNRTGHAVDYFNHCYAIAELDSLLGQYDYIINSLPHTPATDKLFAEKQFNAMAKEAIFINVGRGKSVDEKAMIQALQNNEIKGAGLDVFEVEPLPANSPLWDMKNVIITPHRAGISDFYSPRIIDIFLENFPLYQQGKMPTVNLLDYQRGY